MEQELIPMEKLREMYDKGELVEVSKDAETSLSVAMDNQLNDFVQNNDEIKEDIKKHNKKKIKRFFKDKNTLDGDTSATQVYQTRYDRETWYYKRHKDTIDKYIKKDDKKPEKGKSGDNVIVVDNTDDVLRIGLFKMLLIIWYDLFVDVLGKVIFLPIHLIRYVVELFYKMKKAISITIVIVVVAIIVIIGLIFGISALSDLVQSVS